MTCRNLVLWKEKRTEENENKKKQSYRQMRMKNWEKKINESY